MIELLKSFEILFVWSFITALACLILVGVFAFFWIPLVEIMFRYSDWWERWR